MKSGAVSLRYKSGGTDSGSQCKNSCVPCTEKQIQRHGIRSRATAPLLAHFVLRIPNCRRCHRAIPLLFRSPFSSSDGGMQPVFSEHGLFLKLPACLPNGVAESEEKKGRVNSTLLYRLPTSKVPLFSSRYWHHFLFHFHPRGGTGSTGTETISPHLSLFLIPRDVVSNPLCRSISVGLHFELRIVKRS